MTLNDFRVASAWTEAALPPTADPLGEAPLFDPKLLALAATTSMDTSATVSLALSAAACASCAAACAAFAASCAAFAAACAALVAACKLSKAVALRPTALGAWPRPRPMAVWGLQRRPAPAR